MSALRYLCGATGILWLCMCMTAPLAGSQTATSDAQAAAPTADDIAKGKQLFESTCSVCHGIDAGGASAPNIQGMPASLGTQGVVSVIKNGTSAGMPPFSSLTDAQGLQIVVYLRTLAMGGPSSKAADVVQGDPQKGKAIYAAAGCSGCHIIAGQGGNLGPDLTQIGSVRRPDALRQTLVDPGANLPVGRGRVIQYLVFQAETKDGRTIEGMRMDEDSFTIVLRDAEGDYHTFSKPHLRKLERVPGKSMMPKDTVSTAQLDDLVTYLASLKGAQ
jgi:putative heme-binding domain-containing protein